MNKNKFDLWMGVIATIVVFLLIAGGALLGNKGSSPPQNTVAPMTPSTNTPMESAKIESVTLTLTCGLRYHDYYNELAHKQKATIDTINIYVNNICYADTDSLELTFTNIPINELITIRLEVIPSDNSITVRTIETTLLAYEIFEDGFRHLSYDFLYPTEGLMFPLTQLEREAMSSIVALEHGGGSAEAKRAVAKVILNRRRHGGGSIYNVIFAHNAFTTAKLVNPATGKTSYRDTDSYPYKSCKEAVDHVSLYGLEGFPTSVVYFRSGYYHTWATPYKQIGSLYFSHNPKYM